MRLWRRPRCWSLVRDAYWLGSRCRSSRPALPRLLCLPSYSHFLNLVFRGCCAGRCSLLKTSPLSPRGEGGRANELVKRGESGEDFSREHRHAQQPGNTKFRKCEYEGKQSSRAIVG